MNWEYLGKETLPPGRILPKTAETWRAWVPGGWIVLTISTTNTMTDTATTFYPDPHHEWEATTQ